MRLDKKTAFQYMKIENGARRRFCLQQNLLSLVWILFIANNPLRPINRSGSDMKTYRFIIRYLRNEYRFIKKNVIIFITFIYYKYTSQRIGSVTELPFYGQICVQVHKGYKIFDFRRGTVVKVFDHNTDSSFIMSEIEQLKFTSQIDFAPSLKRWNIEDRWYEEDYMSGSLDDPNRPLDSRELLKKFCNDLVQCINNLISFQQPITINAVEHVHKIVEISRLSRQEFTEREFNIIEKFLDSMMENLHISGDCDIQLVFTHGDFCPANMLKTKHGLKVVDWEGASFRSLLFDFYSFFFYLPVTKNIPVDRVISEINEALPILVSSLARNAPAISHGLLHLEKVYRRLYYIERVCMLVERKATDKNLDIMGFILRYIEVFDCYDELITCTVHAGKRKFNKTISAG